MVEEDSRFSGKNKVYIGLWLAFASCAIIVLTLIGSFIPLVNYIVCFIGPLLVALTMILAIVYNIMGYREAKSKGEDLALWKIASIMSGISIGMFVVLVIIIVLYILFYMIWLYLLFASVGW